MASEIDLAGPTESLAARVAAEVQRLFTEGLAESVAAEVKLRLSGSNASTASTHHTELREASDGTDQSEALSEALVQAFRDLGLSEGHAQIAARGRPLATADPLAEVFMDLGLSEDAAKIASKGWD